MKMEYRDWLRWDWVITPRAVRVRDCHHLSNQGPRVGKIWFPSRKVGGIQQRREMTVG